MIGTQWTQQKAWQLFKAGILATLCFASLRAQAQFPVLSFWKHRVPQLAFTTSTQSIPAKTCSGVATVQTKNASGAATNVSSDLSVNLSGTGSVTFYSDQDCTVAVSSVTVTNGTSSANFYFLDNSVESTTLTASASGYLSSTQSETVSTNNFIWTGKGSNNLWSTGANWSGGVAPGGYDVAVFDGTCSSNCSPSVTSDFAVSGVRIAAGYSGTITQSGAANLTTWSSWVQLAGTFVGGSGAMTVRGDFILLGGSFTSTTGSLTEGGNWKVGSSATFNANSGTLVVGGSWGTSLTVGNENYNNVTFSLGGLMNVVGTMNVLGTLAGNQTSCCESLNGGTILAKGDITLTNMGIATNGGTTVIKVAGSGNQTITGVANSYLPSLEIASTGGTVTFSGTITVVGNYKFTSGTLNAGTSTFVIAGPWGSTFTVGNENYNNVTISLGGSVTLSGTMNVTGTLTGNQSSCCQPMNGGVLAVQGNVALSGGGISTSGGTTVVKMVGSTSQTISGTGNIPNLTIASTGGTVTFSGSVTVYTAMSITSGTTAIASSSDKLNTSSLALNSNTLTKNGGTLTVNGTTVGTGSLYGGTINP